MTGLLYTTLHVGYENILKIDCEMCFAVLDFATYRNFEKLQEVRPVFSFSARVQIEAPSM